MQQRFAVVFRDGHHEAAGSLDVGHDRLRLHGREHEQQWEVEIPFAELSEVRIGRKPNERLNGYRTLLLERSSMPTVQVAPLGASLLPEIADLINALNEKDQGDTLAVLVPLKSGCLDRARKLLAQGPPLHPSSLGLSSHEIYLDERKALFVFRGPDARYQVSKAIRHPAIWRAGLAWQRCFAGPPQIIPSQSMETELSPTVPPAYSWKRASET